jgi:hypothetical protein
MATALPEMFEALGEAATFIPSGGDPVVCHILIDFDVDLQPDGFQSTAWQRSTVIRALLYEIGNEPVQGRCLPVQRHKLRRSKGDINDGLTVKIAVTP